MRPYLQHGRRHASGGSDPIPGLGGSGLPWAVMASSEGFSVGHTGGVNYINTPSGDLYTGDTSVFGAATYTPAGSPIIIGGGTSIGVLSILVEGFYRVILNGNWTTIEAAAVGEVNCEFRAVGSSSFINPGWLFGRQAVKGNDAFAGIPGGVTSGIQTFSNFILNVQSSDTPVYIAMWALQSGATVNGTLSYVQAYVEQVNPNPFTSSFFPIFAPYS